jgi:hypothetical protein
MVLRQTGRHQEWVCEDGGVREEENKGMGVYIKKKTRYLLNNSWKKV